MRISVDIDGVLLDLVGQVCNIYNNNYNAHYSNKDVVQWEFFRDWNLSEEKIYDIFTLAYQNSAYISLVDIKTPYILKELNGKYHVDLVTARDKKYENQLFKRLNTLNIKKGIQYENLIHVKTKPYDVKLGLNYDIYIDDNPYLTQHLELYENKTLLLYDQPWNRDVIKKINYIRVNDWNQIGRILLFPLEANLIPNFLNLKVIKKRSN